MKMPALLAALAMLLALAVTGCEYSSKKVTVRVLSHKAQAGGKYYALLCEITDPKNLAGYYDVVATQRTDQIADVDGAMYVVDLNPSMVASLLRGKPRDYDVPPPTPGAGDFLDSATRVK